MLRVLCDWPFAAELFSPVAMRGVALALLFVVAGRLGTRFGRTGAHGCPTGCAFDNPPNRWEVLCAF